MINLMIVDDEAMVVNIIRAQFDWNAMGVDRVYTANSYQQARALLQRYEIHIMICDIELMQDSGLELLEWTQTQKMNVVSIFLTGYDNFQYCKRALELGGLEYILKPAKFSVLEKAVLHAVEKVRARRKTDRYLEYGENWLNNASAIRSQFWTGVIGEAILPREKETAAAARRYGLEVNLEENYSIVLVRGWLHQMDKHGWDKSSLQFAVKQAMAESLGEAMEGAVDLPDQSLLAFIVRAADGLDDRSLCARCKSFLNLCGQFFHVQMDALVGGFCRAWELSRQMDRLMQLLRSTAGVPGRVLPLDGCRVRQKFSPLPEDEWKSLLSYGQFSLLQSAVGAYLDRQLADGPDGVSADAVFQFVQGLHRLLEAHLENTGASAQWLAEEQPELYRQALRDLQACRQYADWAVQRLPACLREAAAQGDAVQKAKQYVKAHIFDDLSRDDIARAVGMNAEYLSRLFKKREERSLMEYIQSKKMETAADLLQTSQSVGDVAKRLGYHNFAYFTQLFKKHTGQTPSKFKRQFSGQEEV